MEQMKYASYLDMGNYIPPCLTIEKFLYAYDEYETVEATGWFANETEAVFDIVLEFPDNTYMEIQQVRDYGLQSVVGDAGGYIGMFLGFALLQLPEAMFKAFSSIRQYLLERREKHGQTLEVT